MSTYQLCPGPDVSTKEQNFAFWENGFSDDEISKIKKIGDGLSLDNASVTNAGVTDIGIRKSKTGWIGYNDNTQFIYDRLGYVARMLNAQFFEFELYGFVEDLQYTVYTNTGDRYDWHMDKGNLNNAPRKLSLVLQLSDPSEYEGGDLEFNVGGDKIEQAKKGKGLVYAFPSWILHRVTSVTAGTRKSIVVWLCGNKFR